MLGKRPVRSVFQLVDRRSLCLMQLVQTISATLRNMLTLYNASQAPGSLLCEISYHRQLCDGISMASEHKDVWEMPFECKSGKCVQHIALN